MSQHETKKEKKKPVPGTGSAHWRKKYIYIYKYILATDAERKPTQAGSDVFTRGYGMYGASGNLM